jgi:hypothetical protein
LKKDRFFLMAISVVAIVFFVGVGPGAYKTFQPLYECDLVVHKSIPSPDTSRLAVVYEIGCGATAGFNTKVSIAPADRPFSHDQNPPFLELDGQHDLAVSWVSDKLIEIDLPKRERIYRNDQHLGDITVDYR